MTTSILIASAQLEQVQGAFNELDSCYTWVMCDSPLAAERYLFNMPSLVLL